MKLPINSITISNFKCFKEETICFGDLTLIAGLNNAGKSTIYQILLLLKQSMSLEMLIQRVKKDNPILELNKNIIQLGNAEELLNDPKNDKISITINFIENTKIQFVYKLLQIEKQNTHSFLILDSVEIEDVSEGKNNKENTRSFLRFERRNENYYIQAKNALIFENYNLYNLAKEYIKQEINKITDKHPTDDNYFLETVEFTDIKHIYIIYSLVDRFEVDIKYIKNCIKEEFKDFFSDNKFDVFLEKKGYFEDTGADEKTFNLVSNLHIIRSFFMHFLDHLTVINPFRGEPKRIYIETEYKNPLVTTGYLDRRLVYKYDSDKSESKKGTLAEALKYWIPQILIDIDSFNVNVLVNGLASETFISVGKKSIAIPNVGFGISQILPLILKVLANDFCIVDEPEVHLHPALQVKMADFFIEMIKLKKQLIVETHSDHIINKIIYHKLVEGNKDKKINMLWVEKNKDGNNSSIKEIKYDELGYIQNKPEGFLDETEKIIEKINKIRIENL